MGFLRALNGSGPGKGDKSQSCSVRDLRQGKIIAAARHLRIARETRTIPPIWQETAPWPANAARKLQNRTSQG